MDKQDRYTLRTWTWAPLGAFLEVQPGFKIEAAMRIQGREVKARFSIRSPAPRHETGGGTQPSPYNP